MKTTLKANGMFVLNICSDILNNNFVIFKDNVRSVFTEKERKKRHVSKI